MVANLGDFVRTETHNFEGRVFIKHLDFTSTCETEEWFKIQEPALEEQTKNEPWYSILTKGGGAISVPQSDIESIMEPFFLDHAFSHFYFG